MLSTTMDLNDVISAARKNKLEATSKMKIGYSTSVQAPTKLSKTVNPAAIKAFLDRQKKQSEAKVVEDAKKKDTLQKLREDVKHTKKANAMARRTKDNLQVYRGEDYLGRNKPTKNSRDEEIPLSPEADRQHKAFMRKISKVPLNLRAPGSHDYFSSDEDDRKKKKLEKNRKKSRSAAAGLNFNDLLKLAEDQKKVASSDDDSSSDDSVSSDSDDSDNRLTAQEKYEKEKRKRKELEARLKHGHKGVKRKSGDNGSIPLKIGKLQSGLSEEKKKMKIQAIMAKFGDKKGNNSSKGYAVARSQKSNSSVPKPSSKNDRTAPPNGRHKTHLNKSSDLSNTSRKHGKTKTEVSVGKRPKENVTNSKTKNSQVSKTLHNGSKSNQAGKKSNPPGKEKIKTNPYLEAMKKQQMINAQKKSVSYNEMMAKAKSNIAGNSAGQCKLTVQSHAVRTNHPGVAQTDPKNVAYRKPNQRPAGLSNGVRLTPAEEYRRRALAANMRPQDVANVFKRAQVLRDDDDDEDEYDSDMEGFIDEGEEGYDDNISSQIGAIFGYNKNKYGRESEYELSKMDASYKDIEKEEKRSLRIAQIEDAREAKLEEERLKKLKGKKR
uniref:Protein SPT2 homolog n=1 Tax=Phallusia mammillata TaxID=59560 RepID=A0A6F9DU61_9ASCI|nr:protein SPT2 homolog [Phallusia mammillata]